MSDVIDILVIGAGPIGAVYGYMLQHGKSNVQVTVVARSNYAALQANGGFEITTAKSGFGPPEEIANANGTHTFTFSPYRILDSIAAANDRRYMYVVACYKCVEDVPHSRNTTMLREILGGPYATDPANVAAGPSVVLIQNGIGIEEPIRAAFPATPVVSSVAWIGTNLFDAFRVVLGPYDNLVFGLYKGSGKGQPYSAEEARIGDTLATLIRSGGGGAEFIVEIEAARYTKLLWNAAWGAVSTLARCPVYEVVALDHSVVANIVPVVRHIMLEVIATARAWGHGEDVLPLSAIDDTMHLTLSRYQVQEGETPDPASDKVRFKPSILIDTESQRPSEVEVMFGNLILRAREKNVDTPRLDLIYASLKVCQARVLREYGVESVGAVRRVAE